MSLKNVVIVAAVYFYYLNQGACKKIVFSSRVASALCSQRDDYFENKVIPPALMSPDQEGLALLQTCDRWAIHKCPEGNPSCESTASHRECHGAPPASKPGLKTRAYGGTDVDEDEAPWNVLLRFVASWGPSGGHKFTRNETAENDVKGIKEFGRCTGILYNRYTIITTGTCGLRGLDFAVQGVRFVAWFARRKFAFHSSCIYKSEHNKEQTCDIHFHPEFNGTLGEDLEKKYPLHDIAIVKFRKPLDWKKSPHVHAIKIAGKDDNCSDDITHSFYGWGHTDRDWVEGAKQNTPKPLDKWKKEQEVTRMQRLPMSPYHSANCSHLAEFISSRDSYGYHGTTDYDAISPEEHAKRPERNMYFCADTVDFDYKKGLCGGDAGGGLVCHGSKSKQEILMGMKNSWNMAPELCTEANWGHTVFLKLSHYLPWIESIAGKQKPEDLRPAVARSKGPTTEAPMSTPSTPKSQAQPVGGDSKGPTMEPPMSTPKSQAQPVGGDSKGPTTEEPMSTPSTPKSQAQSAGGDSKGPTTEEPMSTPSTPKSQAQPVGGDSKGPTTMAPMWGPRI